uniref:(northern house mosquito) hypothetical protein n=1 Tax=Culex pipiens TaxID=7175 RepID=A0A8D8DL58_CULPI
MFYQRFANALAVEEVALEALVCLSAVPSTRVVVRFLCLHACHLIYPRLIQMLSSSLISAVGQAYCCVFPLSTFPLMISHTAGFFQNNSNCSRNCPAIDC